MLKKILSIFKKVSTYRKITATVFFAMFIWLLAITNYETLIFSSYPVNLFLKIDPLAALTTFIANRSIELNILLISLIVILSTFIFGRFFCSWVCPLGYINQFFSRLRFKKKKQEFKNWQYFKYFLLLFLIILSIFGIQLAGLFDPISITIRSFAIFINPVGAFSLNKLLDGIYNMPVLGAAYDPLKSINDFFFATTDFNFNNFWLIGIIFIVIIGLNFYRNRFWCNNVCPLGALLGLISRFSIFKVTQNEEACTGCKICTVNCHGNADPDKPGELKHSECMVCGNCLDKCPGSGLKYRPAISLIDKSFQPERRRIIIAGAASVIAIPLIKAADAKGAELIRPPGALVEKAFLNKCINCGECVKVCPNNAIQLTLTEAGIEGIFTPFITPRKGYCENYCNLCTQVCPTGALKPLTMEEKNITPIGKAKIDKTKCKPYANGVPCIVCEEHCPVGEKAIKIKEKSGIGLPVVDYDMCIGCGICEYKCPVGPEPAIYVTPSGAMRFKR